MPPNRGKILQTAFALFIFPLLVSCSSEDRIDFLGQTPPGEIPAIFAPDFVSTELDEFGCAMSPDGQEFYFTRTFPDPRRHTIMVCRQGPIGWSQPEIADFSGQHPDAEPNISPDGKRLFFGRLRQTEDHMMVSEIYATDRIAGDWQEPGFVMHGMYASISENGVLYLTDISQGMQAADIVRSEYRDGQYSPPEFLDDHVNSPAQDAHPFIAPDESYLLFDSNRSGGYGSSDLYVCFKGEDDSWGKAFNLGEPINTPAYEAIPSVSPGGEYLFFCRAGDIYWVDMKVVSKLKTESTHQD